MEDLIHRHEVRSVSEILDVRKFHLGSLDIFGLVDHSFTNQAFFDKIGKLLERRFAWHVKVRQLDLCIDPSILTMLPCDVVGPLDGVSDLLLGASVELVLLVGLLVLVPHLGCVLGVQLALQVLELRQRLFVEFLTHPSELLVELTSLPLRRVRIVGIAGGE